ncbi:MAG TPA: hypothetical protein VNO52_08045 [Methylomirabilota bacterium]|nr:hypothetical protein [Methylomirabilota bacterium]
MPELLAIAFVVHLCLSPAPAAAAPGAAVVRGLTGQAVLVQGSEAAEPLPAGGTIPVGATIKTGPKSAVDVFLGGNVGTIRLTQNSVLTLSRLELSETVTGQVQEVQLTLAAGQFVGQGNQSGFGTTYQVKISNGVVAVGSGTFRIHAEGYLVLLSDALIFAHAQDNGEVKVHELKAPPPVYFSPLEGVRPAPKTLVEEVNGQWKARLRARKPEALPVLPAPAPSGAKPN